jgi:crotonobetainyl-CoA:carnitine CoA-transferase CaiB-like acyl-CoA transferase
MTSATGSGVETPLHGVRVLALTRGMAGAVMTMMLADYGAEVVLVESPQTTLLRRTGGHSIWNRGKRSLLADLSKPADREVVRHLATTADVIVDDHSVQSMRSWGLDDETLRSARPDLITCSITGYGTDPEWGDRVATDAAVAAYLGIMNEWGGAREGPIFLGHPALDYSTALLATIGVLASVRARIVSGQGDRIETSLVDGALSLYTMNWWSESGLVSIDNKSTTGDLRFGHKRLLLRMFECADGRLIQVHTGAAGAFDRAMEVFGLGDRVSKTQGLVQMASLLTDEDLEILSSELPVIMKSRPVQEWLELLWSAQVAALPIGEPGEALDDDQARHAGVIARLDDPELGSVEIVGPTVLMSKSPGRISGPAPRLDADGVQLRSKGWNAPGLELPDSPAALEHPLEGLRILEFATFFAAPYGDRILSDLGAEVIKIEGLDGDPMRPLTEIYQGANRGKLNLAANLKHPSALEAVRRLVATADVVQHNLRPGAAERLGIDDASLRPINPKLIYHYSPGYGSTGPKSALQSFAPLLSGYVGVFSLGAGRGNRPHATFGNEDYYNGLLGACACLLGVIYRERTDQGQFVESPQLHSSLLTISEYYKDPTGDYRSVIPRLEADLVGWAAGYRLYQTLDGWICVTCTSTEQVAALADTMLPLDTRNSLPAETVAWDAPASGPLAELLQFHAVERFSDDWFSLLRERGVPVEVVRETSWLAHDAFHDATLITTNRMTTLQHPDHGTARIIGNLVRPTRSSNAPRHRAPTLGEHTRAILREAGYPDDHIDRLVNEGVFMISPPWTTDTAPTEGT